MKETNISNNKDIISYYIILLYLRYNKKKKNILFALPINVLQLSYTFVSLV